MFRISMLTGFSAMLLSACGAGSSNPNSDRPPSAANPLIIDFAQLSAGTTSEEAIPVIAEAVTTLDGIQNRPKAEFQHNGHANFNGILVFGSTGETDLSEAVNNLGNTDGDGGIIGQVGIRADFGENSGTLTGVATDFSAGEADLDGRIKLTGTLDQSNATLRGTLEGTLALDAEAAGTDNASGGSTSIMISGNFDGDISAHRDNTILVADGTSTLKQNGQSGSLPVFIGTISNLEGLSYGGVDLADVLVTAQ